jgi:endonuclease/exonuclease/phosphatase family metal-dependent hydrolase
MNIAWLLVLVCTGCLALGADPIPGSFTVATFNVHNYVDGNTSNREPKSDQSLAQVHESLLALKPDVLAVQEIGSIESLTALREALRKAGHDFPFWEWVNGFDTNIHVAILSRYRITARRSQTNSSFLLQGRRWHTSRGLGEVDILAPGNYRFTVLTAHLKSRRPIATADQAILREQEAIVLRARIDALLQADPGLNLVVLGDFNDTKDSPAIRTLLGKGKNALVDTRPAERTGGASSDPTVHAQSRTVVWTYYYGKEDTYSRVDYLFISRGMAREWEPAGTYVLHTPDWGVASDHRPIIARFATADR